MLGKISQPVYLNFLEPVREMVMVFVHNGDLPTLFNNANNAFPKWLQRSTCVMKLNLVVEIFYS